MGCVVINLYQKVEARLGKGDLALTVSELDYWQSFQPEHDARWTGYTVFLKSCGDSIFAIDKMLFDFFCSRSINQTIRVRF